MNGKIFLALAIVSLAVLVLGGCVTNVESGPSDGQAQPGDGQQDDGENAEGYVDVSPAEAKQLMETRGELVVIDVSPYYNEGHLPGAVHYYLGDSSLDKAIPMLDPSKPYLVYCHVDSVAISGAQKLVDAGFTEVYRLEGNYSAWVDAGYEIEAFSCPAYEQVDCMPIVQDEFIEICSNQGYLEWIEDNCPEVQVTY